MDKLFGIQIDSLLVSLVAILGFGLLVLGFLAWRNPVLFRIGTRNITRRPAQTSLIVLGLMLATLLVSAALVTGDTMNYSIKKTAIEAIGLTDIVVAPKSAEGAGGAGEAGYLSPKDLRRTRNALKKGDLVDGVTPILRQKLPADSPSERLNVPGLEVVGVDPAYPKKGFGPFVTENGRKLSIGDLDPDEGYLNAKAAERLEAGKGDKVRLFLATGPREIEVRGIYESCGFAVQDSALFIGLENMQEIMGAGDQFNNIAISGEGDEVEGAVHSKAITERIEPIFEDRPFEINTIKKDTLKQAKDLGTLFTGIFLIFGQFSTIAGIMLIFLIFVMLAAERKTELGVMRALGSQRRDLLKMFVFEGTTYALLAGVVGSLLGIVVGWGMIRVMAAAFAGQEGLKFYFHFDIKSVIIAYAIGVISTFVIVTFSAWRAGRINIVRAIRDLPEPLNKGRSWKSLAGLILMLILSGLITMGGYQGQKQSAFLLGLSLVIIAVPLIARWFGLPDRAAYSVAGLGLVALWLLPDDLFVSLIPDYREFSGGIEMFFISGMALVTGGVWTVMYNSDILLSVITSVFGRLKGLPPMLRIAVNYPMKNRIRTGLALAMFSLIIFTMVFMSVLLNSMNSLYYDTSMMSGGFDVRGHTGFVNPVKSVRKTLAEEDGAVKYDDLKGVGSVSMAPVQIREKGAEKKKWNDFVLQGIDKGYANHIGYGFKLMSKKYDSPRDVWRAVATDPDVAVVDSSIVPAKVNFNTGNVPPSWQMETFYRDDEKLPEDVYIEVQNQYTGQMKKLRVIGVLDELSIYVAGGVLASQETVDGIMGAPVPPTTYWFKLKSGTGSAKASKALAKAFYENGMETVATSEEIGEAMEANRAINRLLQGFMGLGLVVGIAALGVIAARSVVERRRQIGMLRAIGFRRGMVQNTFILESSFIALLGITIGAVLALSLSRNVILFMEKEMPGISYVTPWVEVIGIGVMAYVASLLTTYLPARQASKVYPAEALRYE